MIDDITDSCIISLQYRLSCFLLDCYFEQKRPLMLLTFLWFITGIGFDVCFQVTTVSKFFLIIISGIRMVFHVYLFSQKLSEFQLMQLIAMQLAEPRPYVFVQIIDHIIGLCRFLSA